MEDEYKQKLRYEKPTTSWRRVVQEGMLATSIVGTPITKYQTDVEVQKQEGFDEMSKGTFEVAGWEE